MNGPLAAARWPLLSPRLAAIGALVPAGHPAADIGTDHGRLPAWLVASGRVPRAVGVDDKEAPLAGARALAATLGLGDALRFERGWGCAGLPSDVYTLTIAGMGGPLMARILAGVPAGVGRLVLQPNMGEAGLREWLPTHGWVIDLEQVVEDRGRWFAVIGAGRAIGRGGPGVAVEADASRGAGGAGGRGGAAGADASRGPGVAVDAGLPDRADLAYGVADLHRDRRALLGRLAADEQRLAELLATQSGSRGRAALSDQLAIVTRVRARVLALG